MSSFTHMSFQTCMSFYLMLNIKTVDGPHWLPWYLFPYYGSQWGINNFWFGSSTFKKNIFFCVQHKREMYTGLEQRVGE